jgi:hypothetical protein
MEQKYEWIYDDNLKDKMTNNNDRILLEISMKKKLVHKLGILNM